MSEILSSKGAKDWWNRKRIDQAMKALQNNEFNAHYFDTEREAMQYIFSIIPAGASVGVGGSITIREMGILEELKGRGHQVYDHWAFEERDPRRFETQQAHLTCDVFLTSTNAVTLNGALVNSDGTGNRVAAMIFGPGKVIVIAGVNKIVSTIEEGIYRIRNVVTPKHVQRKNENAPCGKTGYCVECKGPERRCRITTIIEKRPRQTKDFTVILVGKELGY